MKLNQMIKQAIYTLSILIMFLGCESGCENQDADIGITCMKYIGQSRM